MDQPTAIAIAALALSALSPVATAVVQLIIHARELKAKKEHRKWVFYAKHRAEVIERYVAAAGEVLKHSDGDAYNHFGAVRGEMYLYTDKSLWPLLDGINASASTYDSAELGQQLEALCKALAAASVKVRDPQAFD